MYVVVNVFDGRLYLNVSKKIPKGNLPMLPHLKSLLLFASTILSVNSLAQTTYTIDPTHTSVIATWNHFGFSNPTAAFSDVSGSISYDEQNPSASSINVSIPVKTVDTFVPKLTDEFMAQAYFDVSKFPTATFESKQINPTGGNTYDVTGDLTIKGTTKSVVFKATLNGKGPHPMTKKPAIGFDAQTTIMRSDFGIDQYVPNVSDEVTLTITTEAQAD
jgi:polyisoprenoid-binding protein YceI